ncbi:NADH-quinone oxidoreductase subunit C [Geobacillus zalihae]|uniref:NADH-quinone oxidoreductase subunit C n=1 Tax=Geobacillus zalihae TaxID=213419 RepID=A0A7H1RSQ2_9BACL|nr:NADH-quinone oxidoreductase subunit C [Geobacillus zalihae]OQP25005.1 NADH-quinone oxidoreductase subunit C [Geobacillus zalihae]QNU17291.1 NADH-quinone oxidoreductase subunit C [Geobacillus zalihae]
MDEEKDLAQRKKEAAERAKQLAREKLAARQAAEQAKSSDSVPDDGVKAPSDLSTQPANKETDAAQPASAEDLAAAKKRAAEEARAKAAELRRQREAASGAATGDDLEAAKRKAAEEARAKAAELRRQREAAESGAEDDLELAKKKAAAAAKARAAALAKQKAAEAAGSDDELAKQKAKAAAAAKARAAALAKQQGDAADDEAKQKAIAAAKAKAAAAARAKAAAAGEDGGAAKPSASSPNDPLLEKYVRIIHEHLGSDVLEDAYINRLAKDVPTLVVKKEAYYKVAELLKGHEQLQFDYLSELHGTDFQTHMEVYVHLYSYPNRQPVALKVKIERDNPEVDSLVPLWPGANWPECEAYDLLGIRFRGHPNLIRIFLGEQWVGHPLRKDYEPYDAEV